MKPSLGIVYFQSQLQGLSLSVFPAASTQVLWIFVNFFLADLLPLEEMEVK